MTQSPTASSTVLPTVPVSDMPLAEYGFCVLESRLIKRCPKDFPSSAGNGVCVALNGPSKIQTVIDPFPTVACVNDICPPPVCPDDAAPTMMPTMPGPIMEEDGLTTAAIVGIVFAVILALALAVGLGIFFIRRRNANREQLEPKCEKAQLEAQADAPEAVPEVLVMSEA